MKIIAPKGTKDIYYEESKVWQYIDEVAKKTFDQANFQEIRTPIFEYTELFQRGVGESTDIVNKEMYNFIQKDRSFTLRPENTAGVVRAYVQNGFFKRPSPQKFWYNGPMFRYERPQSGRQRQFHQIGLELFGVSEPTADAEAILSALRLFKNLKISDLKLNINNIGCHDCRNSYKEKIKVSLESNINKLCDDCKTRHQTNPLRLLDCKNEACQEIYSHEPVLSVVNSEFTCKTCTESYLELQDILQYMNISYQLNRKLVRGLDYYNGTVFEITSNNLGAQNAVCGGGRYDGLVELLGGPSTPAVGWALGVERLVSLISILDKNNIDVYIVTDQFNIAMNLADILRNSNIKTDINLGKSKIQKQLEKANKLNAKFAIIIGADEVEKDMFTVKNLLTSEQYQYTLADTIACIIENCKNTQYK